MRIQLYKNENKVKDEDPDFIVRQKQRLNDGTSAYETVDVGVGYKLEGPDFTYIDVSLKGFGTNNKPQ